MLWNKIKIINHTNKLHNKSILATGHSKPLKIRTNKPRNLSSLAKEVDQEEYHRETPRAPTHSQAEWES